MGAEELKAGVVIAVEVVVLLLIVHWAQRLMPNNAGGA